MGNPYEEFREALAAGDLARVRETAAALPDGVPLADAVDVVLLFGSRHPKRYEEAAVRWTGRLCVEQRIDLDELMQVITSFQVLGRDRDSQRSRGYLIDIAQGRKQGPPRTRTGAWYA